MNTEYYINRSLVSPLGPPYFIPVEGDDRLKILGGFGGASPIRRTIGETIMTNANQYAANASRRTSDDTNIVSFLSTALIAVAGVLLVATSLALI
jgi:hypothetical protein